MQTVFFLVADVQDRCDLMLSICLDFCHSLLFWEANEEIPAIYAQAIAQPKDDVFLTMLYNDEVHTYQQVTDALQRACGINEMQATDHAARVDREGRSPVRVGTEEDCDEVKQVNNRRCLNASVRHTQVEIM